MTQEQKYLLLKDLCARLPYGVKVQAFDYDGIETVETLYQIDSDGCTSTIECDTLKYTHKPYLFPLSSMTEEQKHHYRRLQCHALDALGNPLCFDCHDSLDWLNKNHFDYRGLIEKGLAIDATGKNIY